jgi:hypothetical protein
MDMELSEGKNLLNGAILGFAKSFFRTGLRRLRFFRAGRFIDVPFAIFLRHGDAAGVLGLHMVVPTVVIVDEILAVGDDHFRKKAKDCMMQLMKGGIRVLFVSHSLGLVRDVRRVVCWCPERLKRLVRAGEVCGAYAKLNIRWRSVNVSKASMIIPPYWMRKGLQRETSHAKILRRSARHGGAGMRPRWHYDRYLKETLGCRVYIWKRS